MSEQNAVNPLGAQSRQLERLVEAATPSVVSIESHGRALASGLLWRPGVVVTASDAVEGDDALAVSGTNLRSVEARLAGRDPSTDIAVLRLAEQQDAPSLITTSGEARIGQMVLAVGRGGEGVIAALGMVAVASGSWQSRRGGKIDALIRLDLRLDPRSEGGIVIDAEGRLIGMPVFGPRRRPLVIPAATIERIAPKLLAEGRIKRGYLGIGAHPIRLDEALVAVHALPSRRALMVVSLDPDGPARKAGVLLGDVILSLDGETVSSLRSLFAQLTPENVNKPAEIKILRAGQMATAKITIGANPVP